MLRRFRYEALGILMLAVLGGLVWLSVAMFSKTFTDTTPVSLEISRAGLQLLPGSDVKMRGIIVGSVKTITSDGTGAEIKMELQPDKADKIPANVSARLVPKTIFGEKYVDLVLPVNPSAEKLTDGAVIPEDRSTPALEINQALDDLLPVLQAVQPAELNATLTALATALEGKGEQLGQTLVQLRDYVQAVNPHVPQLGRDLDLAAQVAEAYDAAAPDLLDLLRNLTTTSITVVDQQTALVDLFLDVTAAADATGQLLLRSEDDLVEINEISTRTVKILKRYSPMYPCFIRGVNNVIPRIKAAQPTTGPLRFGPTVTLEFLPPKRAYNYPEDLPEFEDKRGPNCYGLPNPPNSLPIVRYKDGTGPDTAGASPTSTNTALQPEGKPAIRTPLKPLLGPLLGLRADRVPDIAHLLYGPLLNGSRVSLR